MPNISELRQSKYLKKENCHPPLILTINGTHLEDVGMEGSKDERYILTFEDHDKGMVLNTTNGQIIAEIVGSEEMDDWTGKQIEIYDEPNVFFAGKKIGGIRVRKPAPLLSKELKKNQKPFTDLDDDLREKPY